MRQRRQEGCRNWYPGSYSGIWIARGLHPGGILYTLDEEPKHAKVAQANFTAAGMSDVIQVLVGDAHSLLIELSEKAPFDFEFIDTGKPGYPAYFDWVV